MSQQVEQYENKVKLENPQQNYQDTQQKIEQQQEFNLIYQNFLNNPQIQSNIKQYEQIIHNLQQQNVPPQQQEQQNQLIQKFQIQFQMYIQQQQQILYQNFLKQKEIERQKYLQYQPKTNKKYILVLDLDETLIHTFSIDNSAVDFYERPYYDKFLQNMSEHFEIVVFTAALEKYASPIIDLIDPNHCISGRLYRQHMKFNKNQKLVKDLSVINKDLSKVIIVDNLTENFEEQQENGYLIEDFRGDQKDNKLEILEYFLQQIIQRQSQDVRIIMGERNQIEQIYIEKIINKQKENSKKGSKDNQQIQKGESIDIEVEENSIHIESDESIGENNSQKSSGKTTPENFITQENNNYGEKIISENDIENQITATDITNTQNNNQNFNTNPQIQQINIFEMVENKNNSGKEQNNKQYNCESDNKSSKLPISNFNINQQLQQGSSKYQYQQQQQLSSNQNNNNNLIIEQKVVEKQLSNLNIDQKKQNINNNQPKKQQKLNSRMQLSKSDQGSYYYSRHNKIRLSQVNEDENIVIQKHQSYQSQ